jgi:ribosomal protein S18 acetylase RimI-like enzyme
MNRIEQVVEGPMLEEVRTLFLEYQRSLDVDLCFQGFEKELAELPGGYAPPSGGLFLALLGNEVAGCVGVRGLEEGACEMKRLFVRDAFKGQGVGRTLAEHAIAWSRRAGYERMLLDTLPSMVAAQRLYETLGFRDVESYRFNPVGGTRYMELELT